MYLHVGVCRGEALWLAHIYLKVYSMYFPSFRSLSGLPSYYKLLFEVPVIFGKAILKVVIRDFSCHFRALWKYNSSSPLLLVGSLSKKNHTIVPFYNCYSYTARPQLTGFLEPKNLENHVNQKIPLIEASIMY